MIPPETAAAAQPIRPEAAESGRKSLAGEGPLTVRLFATVDEIDAEKWDAVLRPEGDFFMDRRVLRGMEKGFANEAKLRFALVEQANEPVAAAVLTEFVADASLLAEGAERHVLRAIRSVCPPLIRLRMLFCGTPVSAGQNHLRIAAHTEPAPILKSLHETLLREARRIRAKLIVFKEFGPEEDEQLGTLASLGYRRADSLPMNHAPAGPESFDAYLASLKSRKRSVLKRSRQKFAAAGLTVEHRSGGDETAALITDDVHRLYVHVLDRAKVRLERLPLAFFRELAREAGELVRFTFLRKDSRVVAFACSSVNGHEYHQMFVGYDPSLNDECDLYFNLFFEAVDVGFRLRPQHISVGQSADDFKAQKLSCVQTPLYFHVRGVDWPTRIGLKYAFSLFCPPRESNTRAAEAYARRLSGASPTEPADD